MARGLPLPAPDEIPPEISAQSSNELQPIPVRGKSMNDNPQEHPSALHGFLGFSTTSPSSAPTGSSPLFRGRSKTLASFTNKTGSQSESTPQEIKLPHEPYINGQPVEAYLYKDASECPICFLYYPPYLNRTRCCDQPICSECFVQIKRPDPHPPEHAEPGAPAAAPAETAARQAEEGLLMSEPAQCPFCVQPEFGVTYDPPQFRRGLAFPAQAHGRTMSFANNGSPLASSSSLPTSAGSMAAAQQIGRRRATSLSATAPQVIATDKVRPDWAKKLSDARAQAARRSAAATALHNAAYLMGGFDTGSRLGFGRRRRQQSGDITAGLPAGVPIPNMDVLLSAIEASRAHDGGNEGRARIGSRSARTDDLEELMLMEAIRQSLIAEEERKRKEEREAAKTAKKEEKNKAKEAKEQKKADKIANKSGTTSSPHMESGSNGSPFYSGPSAPSHIEPISSAGKGKAKADSPADSTSSTGRTSAEASTSIQDPQRHLEQSRANLSGQALSYPPRSNHRLPPASRLRNDSDASDSGSSLAESVPGSLGGHDGHGEDFAFDSSPNTNGQYLPHHPAQQVQSQLLNASKPPSASATGGNASGGVSLAAMMVQQQADEGAGHGVRDHEQLGRVNENERARILQAMSPRESRGERGRDQKYSGDVGLLGRAVEETR